MKIDRLSSTVISISGVCYRTRIHYILNRNLLIVLNEKGLLIYGIAMVCIS